VRCLALGPSAVGACESHSVSKACLTLLGGVAVIIIGCQFATTWVLGLLSCSTTRFAGLKLH
jgi:hypothetical protein